MNIVSLFLEAAKKYPDHKAIIEGSSEVSYSEMEEMVRSTAAYFVRKGIRSGDRVLVFIPMSIDLYRVVLALFRVGATAVFLDEWVSFKRLEICCQLADCRGFIGVRKARWLGMLSREIRRIPIKLNLRGASDSNEAMADMNKEDSALITFTTGSTGIPKAADRTHGFLYEQFLALVDEMQPKPDDVAMPVLPIVLLVNLGIGTTSVIAPFKASKPEKMKPWQIIHQMLQHGVTQLTASPYFITRLSNQVLLDKLSLPDLKKVFTGGAPVFPSDAKMMAEAFPKAQVNIVYGSTEAEPISSISAPELVNRAVELSTGLPVGSPFHKTDLKIIRWTDKPIKPSSEIELSQITLNDGEIGEIIVSGPHVLDRYYKNPEAFAANKITADEQVWHRTGDSGFVRNGELYLTGRCAQLIPHKSGYLAPFIVEGLLHDIPKVSIGTLIQQNGDLLLVLESTIAQGELTNRLPDVPFDRLVILRQIPRDPRHFSKIDYGKLREMLN